MFETNSMIQVSYLYLRRILIISRASAPIFDDVLSSCMAAAAGIVPKLPIVIHVRHNGLKLYLNSQSKIFHLGSNYSTTDYGHPKKA